VYAFAAKDEAEVRAIVAADPGVQNGTLALDGVSPWMIMWDGLSAPLPENAGFFMLDYGPGRTWLQGKTPMQQSLSAHRNLSMRMRHGRS
jgi:hypothetical protein